MAVLGACALDGIATEIDVRRVGDRVEVRRTEGGVERVAIDVVAGPRVVLTATIDDASVAIDAAATAPGIPITATLRAEAPGAAPAMLSIRNDLVTQDGATYRLALWQERNLVVASLAAPLARSLAALAPYREAVESRLAEASPVFRAIGLFQPWPDGTEPPWPALDDPRDRDPPGHLAGDLVGIGMTCSTDIRCPNSAPFCVTRDHSATFGVCTRACASDTACGPGGRCAQLTIDIPDVTDAVLTCALDCTASACPGLLACAADTDACEATQDHPR